jgi:arylsulfatase A-like enzyme
MRISSAKEGDDMADSMDRRQFLARTATLAVAAPALLSAAPRPNIILCMGDDHGWWETSYNHHPFVRTPVLDEMAGKGVRFERMYSAAPECSPTRGSVLTGRHPNRYGTFYANMSIRPQEITLAQILKRAGYACAHVGKWHLGPVNAGSPTNPGAMGFDEWLSHDNWFDLNPSFSRNGAPPREFKGESSEIVVNEASRLIAAAERNRKPSFTVIWFGSPHEPYFGIGGDIAAYRGIRAALEERYVASASKDPVLSSALASLAQLLQARYAEITAMDRALGQLRAYLRKDGLDQNTILWYCGDNGVSPDARLNMPLRGFKAQVYEGGVRVPGVLEWPEGIPRPRTTAMNVVTSDILPTICDVLSLPLPDRPLDGISVRSSWGGTAKARSSPICFWEYDTQRERAENPEPYIDPELQRGTWRTFRNFRHPKARTGAFGGEAAILGSQYKLIAPSKGQMELYDVRADPAETSDLARAKPDQVKDMEQQLRSWQRSVEVSLTGADYPEA